MRIFAQNEVGFSDPLENEEAFKVVRPPGIYLSSYPSYYLTIHPNNLVTKESKEANKGLDI